MGGEEETAEHSRFWIDLVVKGTLELLLHSIETLPALSKSGSEQLATDLEYFKVYKYQMFLSKRETTVQCSYFIILW